MKRSFFYRYVSVFLLLHVITLPGLKAQVDTLMVDQTFSRINLSEIANRFSSSTNITIAEAYENSLTQKPNSGEFAFFGIDEDYGFLSFSIKNTTSRTQNVVIEIYNALLNRIQLYEVNNHNFELLNTAGTGFPFNARVKNDRNFIYPIQLQPQTTKSYIFQFKKEKISIVVPAKISSERTFQKQNKLQYLCLGMYYGLCFISIIISLYIFTILRKNLYLLYAIYIVFLGLYLFSYLGLYFQFFVKNNAYYNKYIHVFFTVCSTLVFVLFSLKVLKAKSIAPRITKFLYIFLGITFIIRFAQFYLPDALFTNIKSFIIKFWYASFFIINAALILLIYKSFKHQRKITFLYATAYSFLGLGTIVTVINLSSGKIDAFLFGLPVLFYASFLEIVFLTFTIILMVKGIYDERNLLSKKLVVQEKKNLTAFIKGEDEERKRISKELHDNIGSQLSYLKRFVSDKFKDEKVTETIDIICTDVRNLSHDISPSDFELIGVKNAISDLCETISGQTSLTVSFNAYQFPEILSDEISTQLYRVLQEVFNNIIKHAKAKTIDVQLIGLDGSISVSIEDDGIGFNPDQVENGLGLKNMRSRIQQLNGTLTFDTRTNAGTAVLITIPTF